MRAGSAASPASCSVTMRSALPRSHPLALARTELETLAGLGSLDAPGLVDLAEVRWRTGDLTGAGEAAVVALDAGADDPVALVIAGMPRSAVWPPDAAEPPPTAGTLFHRDTDDDSSIAALRRATTNAPATTAAAGSAVAAGSPKDGSNGSTAA